VRSYLPEGHVTDGSVDYKQHIQACFDEHLAILFAGSDDPQRPMVHGIAAESMGRILRTRPGTHLLFGPNAIIRRLPSMSDLIMLGQGTRVEGAVVDDNKYAHWPLVKDRPVRPYAFAIGHAFMMGGRNVLSDCVVYDNAGIAFGAWSTSDNRLFRCRDENCGFLEATGRLEWAGEQAPADGFYFSGHGRYNTVKDSTAIDWSRWDFAPTENMAYCSFMDCRGGDLNIRSYGFIDIESAGPANTLVRCRSPNSHITVQQFAQDIVACRASHVAAEHAEHLRMLWNTTSGGAIHACQILDDRLISPGRTSPMLIGNRVVLAGPDSNHSLTVVASDGVGTAADNVVYGREEGERRSTPMLLYGVGARSHNLQVWGKWPHLMAPAGTVSYTHATFDRDSFKKPQSGE
jgi:hypothetical protein